jgi:hypothetical protein
MPLELPLEPGTGNIQGIGKEFPRKGTVVDSPNLVVCERPGWRRLPGERGIIVRTLKDE